MSRKNKSHQLIRDLMELEKSIQAVRYLAELTPDEDSDYGIKQALANYLETNYKQVFNSAMRTLK
ncbi:hypothetical protein LHL20_20755 [Alteromonas sp. McT4-15]|uniref:hypothetical protein n=1 Tax=Alteromonas sp. McT4-15 TaxID=2881256 RepID=UPI001CF879E5|nr:hypothetical protein [Alteromonas sp. McT4-15]MCB4438653.1 hypothetical protein [Alteromonas sp. McT4-15]